MAQSLFHLKRGSERMKIMTKIEIYGKRDVLWYVLIREGFIKQLILLL
jgi:hypothetical protein